MHKVLQVVSNMDCGGIENFIINMYDQAVKQDIQFDFIYLNSEKKEYFFDKHIKENGGKIFTVGSLKIKNFFIIVRKIKKIIKENGPYEALHIHTFYSCGIVALMARIAGAKKIITHSHTTKDNKAKNGIFRKAYRLISKILIMLFSDYKVACGKEAGKALYLNNNFKVINNGIPIEKFNDIFEDELVNEKNFLSLSENEKVIIHVGNFFDVKNHEYIIKIAEDLKKRKNKFKILLLGDGELKENIRLKVNEKNLQDNVIFVGLVDNVYKYLLLSDVFILPSKYEGFPVSLIEAQAAGLSCVVSNVIDPKVNLEINDFFFININNEDVKLWSDTIEKCSKKRSLEYSLKKICELKMDSKSSVDELFNIYLSKN